jgi:hypothetical protein
MAFNFDEEIVKLEPKNGKSKRKSLNEDDPIEQEERHQNSLREQCEELLEKESHLQGLLNIFSAKDSAGEGKVFDRESLE